MEMSGKIIAEEILAGVRQRISKLQEKEVIPELAIVTVGGEDAWLSYVSQKLKTAERLGIKTQLIKLSGENEDELHNTIKELNENKNVHGIIVQRPIPKEYDRKKVIDGIAPVKDIDGFRDNSLWQKFRFYYVTLTHCTNNYVRIFKHILRIFCLTVHNVY